MSDTHYGGPGKTHNERKEEKAPPPPEEMVDALQDRVYAEAGPTRPAKSYRHDPTGQRSDKRDEITQAEATLPHIGCGCLLCKVLRRVKAAEKRAEEAEAKAEQKARALLAEEKARAERLLGALRHSVNKGHSFIPSACTDCYEIAALEQDGEPKEAEARVERADERQEHEDTAPHEGCGCRVCRALRRAEEAEASRDEARAEVLHMMSLTEKDVEDGNKDSGLATEEVFGSALYVRESDEHPAGSVLRPLLAADTEGGASPQVTAAKTVTRLEARAERLRGALESVTTAYHETAHLNDSILERRPWQECTQAMCCKVAAALAQEGEPCTTTRSGLCLAHGVDHNKQEVGDAD